MFDKVKCYTFEYGDNKFYIPKRMESGIELYITRGIGPGSFLTAIICNDLSGAVRQADEENLRNIPAYVSWFYNEAPSQCWGSKERMYDWMRLFYVGDSHARID